LGYTAPTITKDNDGADMTAFIPFSLNFHGTSARFPFIFDGKPVTTIGNKPAPFCLISAREAGDMVFRQPNRNREDFFLTQGIPVEKVYSLTQVHSRDVFTLGNSGNTVPDTLPSSASFAREGDGMVSFSGDIFLAVTVADCLPVFLLDTENGYFALLHSGWKGTGIAANALEIMHKAGSKPEAIAAVLGPCIQGCCYRVDQQRAENFDAMFGSANYGSENFPLGDVIRKDDSGWYINLQAANAKMLISMGVRHIAYCTDCTFTDTRLGSFRREGAEAYTLMVAVAGVPCFGFK
jgi:YfiH family protein